MKTCKIGLIDDSKVNIHKIIEKLTKNNTNKVIYNSVSGPVEYEFIDYKNRGSATINYILILTDPAKELTKQEKNNLLQSIPRRIPLGVITTSKISGKVELAEEVGADFCSHLDLTSGCGSESIKHLLSEFAGLPVNIIYDPPHILNKFAKYLELVNEKRVLDFIPATNAQVCTKASGSFVPPTQCKEYVWTDFDNTKTYPFGTTLYQWYAFKGHMTKPDNYDPNKHIIRAKFAMNRVYPHGQWCDNFPAGPEGRIWYNNETIGATDSFHDAHVVKDDGDCEVRIFTGRSYGNHSLTQFGIEMTDKQTETLYYRLKFLINLIDLLDNSNPDKARIIRLVDAAVRLLDIRNLQSDIALFPIRNHDTNDTAFYNSIPAALEILRSIKDINNKPSPEDPCISIMCYSHLDTCWQWPYQISRYKSANTISSMLHLIENPPDEFADPVQWKYLATASQHYKWLQEDDNQLLTRVLNTAKNGRWIVDGLSWLEHECVLLNGESLIRQMMYGKRVFEGEFGYKQNCLFLPDCFGFSAALPQVLKGFRIEEFVTSKLSWSEYNEFPYDSFVWRGNDGSEVFAHYITTNTSSTSWTTTYTGEATVPQLVGTYTHYKQKDICRHAALHTAGNGDGGGGVTEEMVWNMNLLKELPKIEGVPTCKFPDFPELFSELKQNKQLLPVWDDELYLEYHRGTLTTQEETKRLNRKLEFHLRNTEFLLTVMGCLYGYDANSKMDIVREVWENACLYEFHDALPGTTVNEATIDIYNRGQKSLAKIIALETELANQLATQENSNLAICTTAPFYGWKTQQAANKDSFNTSIYERTKEDNYNKIDISYADEDSRVHDDFQFDSATKTVTTNKMTLVINEYGGIKSVKVDGREFIQDSINPFMLYEDRPLNWPAWDIQLYHKEMQDESPVFQSITQLSSKQLQLNWTVKQIGEGKAELTTIQQIWSFSGTTIDMTTSVHWTQHDKLLKYVIPTTIRSRKAKFGLQFGYIERETHKNTMRDFARFEASGRWADLSDTTGGITMCSDVKAGFDVHGQIMMMSLLKAPLVVDKWADFGDRRFIIRLDFHNEPFSARAQKLADGVAIPNTFGSATKSTNSVSKEFVKIENDKLLLTALKVAEAGNGYIARFVEPIGGWTKATVEFPLLDDDWTFQKVTMEELSPEAVEYKNKRIVIEAKPFEVVTIFFKPNKTQMSPSKFTGKFFSYSYSIDMCGDIRF